MDDEVGAGREACVTCKAAGFPSQPGLECGYPPQGPHHCAADRRAALRLSCSHHPICTVSMYGVRSPLLQPWGECPLQGPPRRVVSQPYARTSPAEDGANVGKGSAAAKRRSRAPVPVTRVQSRGPCMNREARPGHVVAVPGG